MALGRRAEEVDYNGLCSIVSLSMFVQTGEDGMQSYRNDCDLASIELLACDMDCTLLDDAGRQPERMPERIEALADAGVLFCPASGRPAPKLATMFPEHIDRIALCSDNGGDVRYAGSTIDRSRIDVAVYREILAAGMVYPNCVPVLCAYGDTFIPQRDQAYADEVSRFYATVSCVPSFEGIDIEANKVSLYLPNGNSRQAYEQTFRDRFGDTLSVVCAGENWVDFMAAGVDKGSGLAHLCRHVGIEASNVAAVGDTYNDISMLEFAGHSFVVDNAGPHMDEHARFRIPGNNDHGVAVLIDAILEAKGHPFT